MKKLTVKLKQHTPLIHFQGDQLGATLRASEVKPRLDKWLIEKYDITRDGDKKHMFSSDQHYSLDYSLRVVSATSSRGPDVTLMPGNNPEKTVELEDTTILVTQKRCDCFNEIDIAKFVATHNFGKRQSKGFGSFSAESVEGFETERYLQEQNYFRKRYRGSFYPDIYNHGIGKDWRILKSGFNHRGYIKSKLFHFALENDMRWDKRWIKKELNTIIQQNGWPQLITRNNLGPNDAVQDHTNNSYNNYTDNPDFDYQYFFSRACLGLAEHYEFIAHRGITYQVKVNSSMIKRFKSPITFKVIGNMVFAIPQEIPDVLLNHEFTFDLVRKQNNDQVGNPVENFTQLRTPENFNLNDFIEQYITQVGYGR